MPYFGQLIGVVYVDNTHCRFLIYSTKNAEVLTFHEQEFRQIIQRPGWMEFDPDEIWKLTKECIEIAVENLNILDINPGDIVAISICNQRGTTVIWDKETGNPLHNGICWADSRSIPILQTLLKNVQYDVNYLRTRSGLPLSTCFVAPKLKWLIENVPAVSEAIERDVCICGSLDSWILWNITGGRASGVHVTDITNASYTSLMNINTRHWDVSLCKFFRIPIKILPQIRSNSEVYGFVIGGCLNGLSVAGCIGDQPASLLGQLAINVGQNACTMDDSCFVLLNTGQQLIESENGLLTCIAYKLGPEAETSFMLEGVIANAGSTITWLQNKLNVANTELNPNENTVEVINTFFSENSMLSSSCSSNILNADGSVPVRRSEITFVPAFHGLYSPYWRYDARGIILGLTSHTTAQHVTQAAYEATGFQIYEILEALKRDTHHLGGSICKSLSICGEFTENTTFVQFIADIIGCRLMRPQTTSAAGLGAMIAAGITVNVVSFAQAKLMYMPPSDIFTPKTAANRRELLYKRWAYAVRKCLAWNNFETYEADLALFTQRELDLNYSIRRSIPGSIFMTSAFLLLLVARFLKSHNIS